MLINNRGAFFLSLLLASSCYCASSAEPDDSLESNQNLHKLIQELTNRVEKLEHAASQSAQNAQAAPSSLETKQGLYKEEPKTITLAEKREDATHKAEESTTTPFLNSKEQDAQYDQILALYNQAMISKDNAQAASALRSIEAFNTDFPENNKTISLLKMKADLYISQGQYGDGVKAFKQVFSKDPKGIHGLEALFSLCQCALSQGKENDAKVIVAKIEKDFGPFLKEGYKERLESLKENLKKK